VLLAVLVVYAPSLPPDRSFWYRDIYAFWTALSAGFVRVVRAGSWPVWTPYPSFGLPLLADPGNQTLYPFTWLNLVLPQVEWYKAFAVCHAVLAGLGAYALGLGIGMSRVSAFAAGGLFMASGPFQSALSHTVHFAGSAYMPWVAWAVVGAMRDPNRGSAAVLGVILATQVVAGSGDLLLMSGLVSLPLVVALGLRGRPEPGKMKRTAAALVGALALSLVLSAAQWLPTMALIPESMRAASLPGTQTYWSLHPWSLIDLLAPRALSDLPMNDAGRELFYEGREPFFNCLYLGALALGLVALGVARQDHLSRALLAGLALAGLVSLGRFAPLYSMLAAVTPLPYLRYPTKYTIAVALFWAMLAGLGADTLRRGAPPLRRAAAWICPPLLLLAGGALWTRLHGEVLDGLLRPGDVARAEARSELVVKLASSVALALLGLLLAASSRRRWLVGGLLPLLAVGELVPVAQGVNGVAPRALLETGSRVALRLGEGSRIYVSSTQPLDWFPRQLARMPTGWRGPWALALGRQDMVAPPLGARYGLFGSYDGDVAGFAPPLLGNLSLIMAQAEGTPLGLRLLQVAGVEYVVTLDDKPWPQLLPEAEIQSVFRNPIRILRVPEPRPRAYLVGAARVLHDADAVRALGSAGFDPAREVLLGSGDPFDAPSPGFSGQLRSLLLKPDRLVFETESGSEAALVVLDAYHSGWRADVDGVESPVRRANALFRAVTLTPGRHRVSLEYRPAALRLGLALSVLGGTALAAGAISSRRRLRRAEKQ